MEVSNIIALVAVLISAFFGYREFTRQNKITTKESVQEKVQENSSNTMIVFELKQIQKTISELKEEIKNELKQPLKEYAERITKVEASEEKLKEDINLIYKKFEELTGSLRRVHDRIDEIPK